MAGTLKFSVEVAVDQATQSLQALSASFNQAGISYRSSLLGVQTAAKQTGAEIISLSDRVKSFARDQRSEARAANFYVQELAQIIPISNQAKMALGGLGQALAGGMGIGTAIGLATTALGLLAYSFRETGKAAEESAKKTSEEWKKASDEIIAGTKRYTDRLFELKGRDPFLRDHALQLKEVAKKINEVVAARKLENVSIAPGASAELDRLRERYRTLSDQLRNYTQARKATTAAEEEAKRKPEAAKKPEDKPFFGPGYGADLGAFWKTAADEAKRFEEAIANPQPSGMTVSCFSCDNPSN